MRLVLAPLFILLALGRLEAGGASLFPIEGAGGAPFIDVRNGGPPDHGRTAGLLAPARGGLLSRAPIAPRLDAPLGASGIDAALFDIIASAEAGAEGYDAVQHGARIGPPRPPTELTLGEIFDWIDATPGQHHAIGRYQIIPSTLERLVEDLGLPLEARFSRTLQDRLALELAIGAGYAEFLEGEIDRSAFLDKLARVWAGLPTASGKSHYHGYAGNRATIARSRFEAEMERIFPVADDRAGVSGTP